MRGIQYAAASRSIIGVSGILDRPHSRAMTTEDLTFKHQANVIASEAKQSILSLRGKMDCFALLAMTLRHTPAFPPRHAPEVMHEPSAPKKNEGAGKCRVPAHPQPRVQKR
jgi:hypothetical protein